MNSLVIIFFMTLAVIAIAITISLLFRVKAQCPKCGSKDIVETNRETLGSRMTKSSSTFMPGSGLVRLQLDFEITHRCKECGEIFKRKFSETQ